VLDLALTGHGNAVVAWTGERVRAAATDASGRFGAPRDLSPALSRPEASPPVRSAALTDLAAAPGPRAGAQPVVVWRTHRAGGTNVQEAARTG
jgi:hypothetical protein